VAVPELPSGIVTLLFTDLEDSPELGLMTPELYARVVAEHRELVRTSIGGSAGREVDCRGGELLAVFERPRDALLAAVAIQRTHRDHDWDDAAGISARVGVHTGEPILTEGTYLGLDVHRVARLCTSGHGGQMLLSQSTQTLLQEGELPGSVVELGEVHFPGLPRSERVFQLIVADLPSAFPPLRSSVDEARLRQAEREGSGSGPRLVLAEDSVLLREGIAVLLENHGCEIVGQANNPDELLLKVRSYLPDVAIIDVRMPPTHTDEGLRAAQEIRSQHPEVGVLVLSQYVEPMYVVELLAENAAGVGYLLKDRVNDVEEFVSAIHRIADGGTAFDPKVVSELVGRRQGEGVLDALSPREREVLALMAEGRSNQAISERLYLSARAVERHVTSIFTKLRLPAGGEDNRRVLAVLAFLRD
jgi:DNA-binding NarL/FixJ family response regulator/class 3 adenylate cyclase